MKKAARNEPGFFSPRQVAEHLAVDTKTVRRWIAKGDLRFHRMGGQIRISDEDLTSFIVARRR